MGGTQVFFVFTQLIFIFNAYQMHFLNVNLTDRNAKIAREALTQPWQHGDVCASLT